MAIVKQGGSNPYAGKVMTSMGYRDPRPPMCMQCGQRKDGLYTVNANGKEVCPDCASPRDRELLKGTCDPENCACGKVEAEGADPE